MLSTLTQTQLGNNYSGFCCDSLRLSEQRRKNHRLCGFMWHATLCGTHTLHDAVCAAIVEFLPVCLKYRIVVVSTVRYDPYARNHVMGVCHKKLWWFCLL